MCCRERRRQCQPTALVNQIVLCSILRPAEVLETIPEMVVTQPSARGKAKQYFLRGFNFDHNTDFATFLARAPVNPGIHGHGQG